MGHTLRQRFVFKELVQEGLRTKALTLGEEEKKATTNMVYIRFGALQPVSIHVEEMDPLDTEVRVIPDDSEEILRGLVAVNSPDGDRMWGDPISMRRTIGKWLPPKQENPTAETKMKGSQKQPKKKSKVSDDSPKQELRVPVTLADHLKSKRARKPLLR